LTLSSRKGHDVTARYSELHDQGSSLGRPVVLEGEIVALDSAGRPSCGLLQARLHAGPGQAERLARVQPVRFYLFDILFLDGWIIMDAPYVQRRQFLERLGSFHPLCRNPPSHSDRGREVLAAARRHALEGIVAKRSVSRYEPGRRSDDWRKIRFVQRQRF
jgi:bifunctional non-homologous end joining protein LigD